MPRVILAGFAHRPGGVIAAVRTGVGLGLSSYVGGGRVTSEQIMPEIVGLGITRELGPVFVALMLSGRVAATIAAEIGISKVASTTLRPSTLAMVCM